MPEDPMAAAVRLANDSQFRAAVSEDHPDLEAIREAVIHAYIAATGLTNPDLRAVSQWFMNVCQAYDGRVTGGISVQRSILRRVMSSNISWKANHLMTRPCRQCDMYSQVPFMAFFLNIPPQSRQASDTDQRHAFDEAIAADLKSKNFDFSDFNTAYLCVAVTFVVANGRPRSDVDNLAKNLLDGLEDFAYKNDRQIDHLDLLRLRSRSAEEFISVRLACTDIDNVRDVISPTFPVEWVSGLSMTDPSSYLPAATGRTGGEGQAG
jgi:Holliday junction resolvase RusA-like endonuclease